ncbi:MAG: sensor histidine kinase, partial [Flavobacteriaceae bacterium]|nr:sensor histidine kinase [Flavobacteriaceae bacterium]
MSNTFKRTYKFAAVTSLFISLFVTATIAIYFLVTADEMPYLFLGGLLIVCYIFSFNIIQFRVQKYIYKRVKKIYDDVRILDASSLDRRQITTDMETLTKEVGRFAEHKKLEIETLKIRENYRKEFLGNVSHELKTPLFTVQSYILTLLDGAMKDKSVRKKYLQRANKGVERLIY